MSDPPTAVVAASDVQALGVLEAARLAGKSVPRDVSVIGYDDIDLAAYSGLTTVRQPLEVSGQRGSEILTGALATGVRPIPFVEELALELVVRGTTSAPSRSARTGRTRRDAHPMVICAFHPPDRSSTIGGALAWWETAVVYQLYVRSFADSNDDGIGDLAGIRSRLPYLADLGIDAIWLNPCYPSPQADHGYDVADYFDIEPDYGDLDEFDALVRDARAVGIRIMMDVVPNHCSSEHAWFRDGVGRSARFVRTRAVLLPRRSGHERRRAAEQLAGDLRRFGVDPRRRARRLTRSVVPRRVHAGPARSQLEPPRCRRSLRPRCSGSGSTAASKGSAPTPSRWSARRRDSPTTSCSRAPRVPSWAPSNAHFSWRPEGHAAWRHWRQLVDAYEADHPGRQLVLVAEAYTPAPPRHLASVRERRGVPPGVRVRSDARPVERRGVPERSPLDGGGVDAGRAAPGVDAEQPRRPAFRHPVRASRCGDARRRHRRRARELARPGRHRRRHASRPRRGTVRARSARLRVPVRRRGARPPRGARSARRGPSGPDLRPHRRRRDRPRRLPGAAAVDRRRRPRRSGSRRVARRIRGCPSPRSGRDGTSASEQADPSSMLALYRRALASPPGDPGPHVGRLRAARSPTTPTSWCTGAARSSSSSTCPTTSAACRPISSTGLRVLVSSVADQVGTGRRSSDRSTTDQTGADSIGPDAAVWLGP